MKISHIILIIFGALVFLMLGCFLFFGVCIGLSSIEDVIKDVHRLYDHRILAGFIGIIFLSAGYVAVKTLLKRSARDEIFVVDNEYGRTSIALSAVQDLVRKKIKKYEMIKKAKIRVAVQNRILTITVHLTVFSGTTASEIIEQIREELHKTIKNFIGLPTDNVSITVKVSKVVDLVPVDGQQERNRHDA